MITEEQKIFRQIILNEIGPTNPVVCKFALELIDKVPDYFWKVGASSSGKYHPEFGLGEGGLARHSIMVVRWLKSLLEANEAPMSDCVVGMIVAALFHDCCKLGPDGNVENHTVFLHPIYAAKFIKDEGERFLRDNKEFMESTAEDEESFKHDLAVAISCIESHMGKWNVNKNDDSQDNKIDLPKPTNPIEYMVHLADYIASRKYTSYDSEWVNSLFV